MEDFLIYNTLGDRKYPDAYKDNYHCHILCRSGEMKFEAVGKTFVAGPGDLVIWQMTTAVSNVHYSADFDAYFVLISNPFLNLYNPEQVWATKGYVYIKSHPVFHLDNDEWDVIEADFEQFRHRIHSVQQALLQRLGYRINGQTISLYDGDKLLASVTNSVKDMGGFDDDQPLWIGEQLYYDVSSGDPKVIFIPGVKFNSGFVLVYDDMPDLSSPFTVDENGLFTIQEITVTAKQ